MYKIINFCLTISVIIFFSCEEDKNDINCSVNGIVEDNDGGLQSARVELIPGGVDLFQQNMDNAQIVVTANDGKFQLDALESGSYTLQVTKMGYHWVWMSVNGTVQTRHQFELKEGEEKDIKVLLSRDHSGSDGNKIKILDDNGSETSKITFPKNTATVSFQLFNNLGNSVSWNASCSYYAVGDWIHINNGWEQEFSRGVESINPASGNIQPGATTMVLISIDPLIYKIHERSSFEINIYASFNTYTLTLSY